MFQNIYLIKMKNDPLISILITQEMTMVTEGISVDRSVGRFVRLACTVALIIQPSMTVTERFISLLEEGVEVPQRVSQDCF